ncbi:MAG TPA: ATP-dependent protease ATPase subunit HslU [Planctomycetota bacterium]|nr:ATP-dependent protease ATPase subunit HslU [Planctomycetota bacterium]
MKDSRGLTPRKIVAELDRYIVGQAAAKKMIAVAIRNRWRRQQLPEGVREDVSPKNIMLIGPTGVGKTEIARRLASLVSAPFVKVEATRYTEVGYVGRDVESMIRELVETSIALVKQEEMTRVQKRAAEHAEDRLLDLLAPKPVEGEPPSKHEEAREKLREKMKSGQLDGREVEFDVEEKTVPFMQVFSPQGTEEMGLDLPGALGNMFQPKRVRRKTTVDDARRVLAQQEAEKLIDRERVTREGLRRAQENGIVFIDEIDKIVSAGGGGGPDVSRGGVQRDLLPIVEGATCATRYGPVRTDHSLFVAAGAFSLSKPSDLIPELQGRFPLRAELTSLGREDFARILTEPKNAMLKQAELLLATEGITVEFAKDAIEEMAKLAAAANEAMQDIGARRLHTIVEKVLEDISFQAPDLAPAKIPINAKYVRERLKGVLEDENLKKYIL